RFEVENEVFQKIGKRLSLRYLPFHLIKPHGQIGHQLIELIKDSFLLNRTQTLLFEGLLKQKNVPFSLACFQQGKVSQQHCVVLLKKCSPGSILEVTRIIIYDFSSQFFDK